MQAPGIYGFPPKKYIWKSAVLPMTMLLTFSVFGIQTVDAQTRQKSGDQKQSKSQEKPASGKSSSTESQSTESTTETEDTEKKKLEPKKVKIGGIEWYVDYDAAMKVAQKEKKPMWLHFGENPG